VGSLSRMGCTYSQISPWNRAADTTSSDDSVFFEQNSSRNNQKIEKFMRTAYLKLNRQETVKLLLCGSSASKNHFISYLRDDFYGKEQEGKFEDAMRCLRHSLSFSGVEMVKNDDNNNAILSPGMSKVITKEQLMNLRQVQRSREILGELAHRAFPGFLQSASFKRWRAYEMGALSSIRATLAVYYDADLNLNDHIISHHNHASSKTPTATPRKDSSNNTTSLNEISNDCSEINDVSEINETDGKKDVSGSQTPNNVAAPATTNAWMLGDINGSRRTKPSFAEKAFSMSVLRDNPTLLTSSSWLGQLVATAESLPLAFWLLSINIGNSSKNDSNKTHFNTSRRDSGDLGSVRGIVAAMQESEFGSFNSGTGLTPRTLHSNTKKRAPSRKQSGESVKPKSEYKFVYVNQQFETDFGYSRDSVIGTDYENYVLDKTDFVDTHLWGQIIMFHQAIKCGNLNGEFDVMIRRKDDRFVRTYIVTRPFCDQHDNYRYMMCVSVCSRSYAASEMGQALHDYDMREFNQPVLKQLMQLLPSAFLDTESSTTKGQISHLE
jgi:hypothetical protein